MRKSITAILIVCLAVSTAAFAFLWTTEKDNKDDLKEFAQAEAERSYAQFAEYRTSGDMNSYWNGVAAFWAFEEAYRSVFRDTNKSSNYLVCNEVYGYLVGEPEKSRTYAADIAEIMELLSKDIEDLNGHARMLDLRNKCIHDK